ERKKHCTRKRPDRLAHPRHRHVDLKHHVSLAAMRASLSAEEARALALRAQHIGDPTLTDAIDTLDRLGAIQMDSVNILARAHLLVPFARVGPYAEDQLQTQIYKQKRGFEYWGHVASWLPMADYRYFLPRMRRYRDTGH